MQTRLKMLLSDFDAYGDAIPGHRLRDWIEACPLQLDDVHDYCRFHPERYVRNLVQAATAYHALVLCWKNGQRSPIHNHRGSRCAVKVLSGEAVETKFDVAANGMVYPTSSEWLCEGSTCYSEDADIHQVSNLQSGNADLVTLHVYSPPLLRMNMYSLHGSDVLEFFDPVNEEFVSGAGI